MRKVSVGVGAGHADSANESSSAAATVMRRSAMRMETVLMACRVSLTASPECAKNMKKEVKFFSACLVAARAFLLEQIAK